MKKTVKKSRKAKVNHSHQIRLALVAAQDESEDSVVGLAREIGKTTKIVNQFLIDTCDTQYSTVQLIADHFGMVLVDRRDVAEGVLD